MARSFRMTLISAVIFILAANALAQPLVIENESIRVSLEPATNQFTLQVVPSNVTVVRGGKLNVFGTAKTTDISDPNFGDGKAIQIVAPNGAGGQIAVYPNLPFAILQLTLANDGKSPEVLNRVPVVSFTADWGQPLSALTTLGTGGLAAPDKNPGSYVWLAIAEPVTRHGLVAGWLTHDHASGVLFPKSQDGAIRIDARSDYGRLTIQPGKTTQTETLALGYFDDARIGLETWADTVAKIYRIKLPPQPSGYCTWYAEKHGAAADEKSLADLADFIKNNLEPYGASFVQIDDHWQLGNSQKNGPKKNFTAFDPAGPYPSGMKATAAMLTAHGLTPGIWFMPFAGTFNDPWFADKQDYFVQTKDGQPYDTAWGGTCLDMTNPKARDYLSGIVNRLSHEWGYRYFKMDGLWTGLAAKQVYVCSSYKEDNLGDAVFSDPNVTNIEAYRTGLQLVRDAAGPDVFLLGCNVAQDMRVYGASFGLLDAMRIGPDNGGTWTRWSRSPEFGSRNYFLQGRIWYNDPDPNYVRASIPETEAKTIASWVAVSGQFNTNSDWEPDLPRERLDILRRTLPAHGKLARPVDYFENDPPRLWVVIDDSTDPMRYLVALFNWTDKDLDFDVPLARFGLPDEKAYAAYDYWGKQEFPLTDNRVKTKLAAHACLVLAVRAEQDYPMVLSTSRHITQGMVDLTDENWDSATNILSGTSLVVGKDSYDLRLHFPLGWAVDHVQVSQSDTAAGVSTFLDDTGKIVAIESKTSRPVQWRITFKHTN